MDTTAGQDAWWQWGVNPLMAEISTHHIVLLPHTKPSSHRLLLNFSNTPVTCSRLHLPALLSFPSPHLVRAVVTRGFVASSSRAWRWVTWLPPTTLALPSCHHGNVSILTNMPWHPWPSSPICNPISFSHSIIFLPPFSAEFLTALLITLYSVIPTTSFSQFSLSCLSRNVSLCGFSV